MEGQMVDVMLHIDEILDQKSCEDLRDELLQTKGVLAADSDKQKRHLMIIEYDPEIVAPARFIEIARQRGLHTQLIGM
jgi:hypothetical protein